MVNHSTPDPAQRMWLIVSSYTRRRDTWVAEEKARVLNGSDWRVRRGAQKTSWHHPKLATIWERSRRQSWHNFETPTCKTRPKRNGHETTLAVWPWLTSPFLTLNLTTFLLSVASSLSQSFGLWIYTYMPCQYLSERNWMDFVVWIFRNFRAARWLLL